jgi:hypothetical protein
MYITGFTKLHYEAHKITLSSSQNYINGFTKLHYQAHKFFLVGSQG